MSDGNEDPKTGVALSDGPVGFVGNLFSSLTHYGSGPAPVLFGSGYVELGAWWKLGALASIINILIWLIGGGLWWKLLGLW
jgi:DASS family divalent anion:Na+ symporter